MKKNKLIAVILVLSISCNENQDKQLDKSVANIKIAESVFEHFNNHDWEGMANLYIENAEFKDPEYGVEKVRKSRVSIVQHYTEMNQLFPDIKDEIVAIYPSGDKNVIVEFISTGTAPDGSAFALPVCTIFTIENDKITKDYNYYDNF